MEKMPPAIDEAVRALAAPDADAAAYLDYHRRRYAYLLRCVEQILNDQVPRQDRQLRILDVGMSYQTLLVRKLHPEVELATLGYYDHRFPALEGVRHTHFDLNASADEGKWPDLEPFDLIILAEVIEHLYVPPKRVLQMLRGLLRPGGVLLIQTPNPVNLARRLALLGGKSPFEVIRDDTNNPGHYCEYTVESLLYLASVTGFTVLSYAVKNYFGERNLVKTLYDIACMILPGRLAEGITISMRRPYA